MASIAHRQLRVNQHIEVVKRHMSEVDEQLEALNSKKVDLMLKLSRLIDEKDLLENIDD